MPNELKFYLKTPYDRLAKIYTNCFGHMTKTATTPIYTKNPFNIFFSGTKRPIALGNGIYQFLGMWALPGCSNAQSRLTLTLFMARSNLIPNAFIWENLEMFILLYLFKSKS